MKFLRFLILSFFGSLVSVRSRRLGVYVRWLIKVLKNRLTFSRALSSKKRLSVCVQTEFRIFFFFLSLNNRANNLLERGNQSSRNVSFVDKIASLERVIQRVTRRRFCTDFYYDFTYLHTYYRHGMNRTLSIRVVAKIDRFTRLTRKSTAHRDSNPHVRQSTLNT